MLTINRFFNGELSLRATFFEFHLVLTWLLMLFIMMLQFILGGTQQEVLDGFILKGKALYFLLSVKFLSLYCLWLNSKNTSLPMWTYLARIYTVLYLILMFIIITFELSGSRTQFIHYIKGFEGVAIALVLFLNVLTKGIGNELAKIHIGFMLFIGFMHFIALYLYLIIKVLDFKSYLIMLMTLKLPLLVELCVLFVIIGVPSIVLIGFIFVYFEKTHFRLFKYLEHEQHTD